MRLTYDFYNQPVLTVAKNLLGKKLIYKNYCGIITETEAYRGDDDAASHAYRGRTARNYTMFGEPGLVYIYLIYGVYYCLNIVAEPENQPAAVLIRGLKLDNLYLNGPGKICRHLGITRQENGVNLITSDYCYLIDDKIITPDFLTTSRIGIKKAVDKLWRFKLDER